jgi:hypothetical protein
MAVQEKDTRNWIVHSRHMNAMDVVEWATYEVDVHKYKSFRVNNGKLEQT